MAGLQRSDVSFRRQGSSGFVWNDKFLSGEINKLVDQQKEDYANKKSQNLNPSIERSRSTAHRTGRVSAALEPPSPRVSGCGLCSAFGNSNKPRRRPPKSGRRVV